MEKKYYIIPTIKVKEMETESLMGTDSIEISSDTNNDGNPITIGDEDVIDAKPMYGDFNVWEK